MRVTIKYFQTARRLSGTASEDLDVAEGTTVAQLAERLAQAHPAFLEARASLMFAVNAEQADPDRLLREADEVAVLPPFSGG